MAKQKSKPGSPFEGRWHIVSMSAWNVDDLDEEGAFFEFEGDQRGEFRFGLVQGIIDDREGLRDGKPCVKWSWEGSDEMDPAMGRGWAELEGDVLFGRLYFHMGDESGFRAERAALSKGG